MDGRIGAMDDAATSVAAAVSLAFREDWLRIVAILMRITDDRDAAEDCAQDAFARAVERWPTDGVPDRPGAWLTTTARHRAIDRRRREALGHRKLREVADVWRRDEPYVPSVDVASDAILDDRLRLLLACCHPALTSESQASLALYTLIGLGTSDIARVFLVSEVTMSKRLVRAKQRIRRAGIRRAAPVEDMLRERTGSALHVLDMMFDTGSSPWRLTRLMRRELCLEAIRLTSALAEVRPEEPEVRGLLALMLLREARCDASIDHSPPLAPRWESSPSRQLDARSC
jgi:RNA polymerase sigma-70 factor (ECF subfamily)